MIILLKKRRSSSLIKWNDMLLVVLPWNRFTDPAPTTQTRCENRPLFYDGSVLFMGMHEIMEYE